MGLQDVLKNYQPQANEDGGGFSILTGRYKCAITKLAIGATKDGRARYELELTVNDVLEGDKAVGRKLWRNYLKEDDDAVKRFIDDMFTAGIELPRATEEEFEGSFFTALDKEVTVRAWGWTPEKDRQGNVIPVEQREAQQFFKIINPKKAGKSKVTSAVPF